MVRPRNDGLRAAIADAAYDLFRDLGYDRTSYTLIAGRCGVTRALVQYHWSKKELLAIEAMTRMLDETIERLGLPDKANGGESDHNALVAIGSSFFDRLLSDEGWRRFLLDILSSRELSDQVLVFNARWAFDYVGHAPRDEAFDEIVVNMGGFYELLYYKLRHGLTIDVKPRLRVVVDGFMRSMRG